MCARNYVCTIISSTYEAVPSFVTHNSELLSTVSTYHASTSQLLALKVYEYETGKTG